MSTPTPRTSKKWKELQRKIPSDLGWLAAHELHDFARNLETELTAANARIAELEGILSETQAQSAERISKICSLLDIECAEATPEDRIIELQAQLASAQEDSERWKYKHDQKEAECRQLFGDSETAKDYIDSITAAASEDDERMKWMECKAAKTVCVSAIPSSGNISIEFDLNGTRKAAFHHDLRSAIDSARRKNE